MGEIQSTMIEICTDERHLKKRQRPGPGFGIVRNRLLLSPSTTPQITLVHLQ
jgi:hypothetical protein